MTEPFKTSLILVVDDNPRNLQVMGQMLKEKGYRVSVAQSGIQALDFVKKKEPDLILLDIMMPEMDGFETCRSLRTHGENFEIPIIFITALNDASSKLKAFNEGGVDYITKPFMKEEVMARINVHLRLRAAMEKLKSMAVTDEMTGVFNRRYAFEVLAREMNLSQREKRPFVLCYIDVDNLKTINDTYGHEAGDTLILEVVTGLGSVIRVSDYLFRMGGDEFLLLLPNTKLDEAALLIKRVNENLNSKEVQHLPVDFSYGFSIYQPGEDISVEKLIKRADVEMYVQKFKKKKEGKIKSPL